MAEAGRARGSGRISYASAEESRRRGRARRQRPGGSSRKFQVLESIREHGPSVASDVATRLNISIYEVQKAVRSLTYDQLIVLIGTAWDAHRTDVRQDAKLWAVAGTPRLPRRPLDEDDEPKPRPPRNPERIAAPRRIGRGLGSWGGWR